MICVDFMIPVLSSAYSNKLGEPEGLSPFFGKETLLKMTFLRSVGLSHNKDFTFLSQGFQCQSIICEQFLALATTC